MTTHDINGMRFYSWNIFSEWEDRIRAVLTTRKGGVSKKPFEGLNLGHHVEDKPESVEANRRAVAKALGLPEAPWALTHQIHETRIKEAVPPEEDSSEYDSCDSLSVQRQGIISAIILADCLPVIIYDPLRHAGIISHAGWRGTVSGMVEKSVQHLLNNGSRVQNLIAATGPGIGPCCYPVAADTAEKFSGNFNYPEKVVIKENNGGFRLNLEAANISRLRKAGLSERNIGAAGFCTACREKEFYSYRKEGGLTGRQAALMVLL